MGVWHWGIGVNDICCIWGSKSVSILEDKHICGDLGLGTHGQCARFRVLSDLLIICMQMMQESAKAVGSPQAGAAGICELVGAFHC